MDQQNENIEFKNIQEYLDYWNKFFVDWNNDKEGENMFKNDKIWSKHK